MRQKRQKPEERASESVSPANKSDATRAFHLDFLHPTQELAWKTYQESDILFLIGCAGTGKSHLATGFAIHDVLRKAKERIVITRPVVESGESLGFLPGDLNEKILPYMMPIYDCMKRICGTTSRDREIINASLEVCPLAYMRGRTFNQSVFILDEAQNCTHDQIKLAVTRLGQGSKMIITGDPDQSDLPGRVASEDIISKLSTIAGVGVVRMKENCIVRHPIIAKILKRL